MVGGVGDQDGFVVGGQVGASCPGAPVSYVLGGDAQVRGRALLFSCSSNMVQCFIT